MTDDWISLRNAARRVLDPNFVFSDRECGEETWRLAELDQDIPLLTQALHKGKISARGKRAKIAYKFNPDHDFEFNPAKHTPKLRTLTEHDDFILGVEASNAFEEIPPDLFEPDLLLWRSNTLLQLPQDLLRTDPYHKLRLQKFSAPFDCVSPVAFPAFVEIEVGAAEIEILRNEKSTQPKNKGGRPKASKSWTEVVRVVERFVREIEKGERARFKTQKESTNAIVNTLKEEGFNIGIKPSTIESNIKNHMDITEYRKLYKPVSY